MNKIKKHKLIKFSIIAAIIIILLSSLTAAAVWQLRFSYSVIGIVIEERKAEPSTLEHEIIVYERSPEEYFYGDLKNDNPFPSDDYRDYSDLYLSVVVKNDGILDLRPEDVYIERITPGHEIIALDTKLMFYLDLVESHSQTEVGIVCLFVCRENMTDEEVIEILKDYKITLYAENDIRKDIKFEIYLKDFDMKIEPLRPYEE